MGLRRSISILAQAALISTCVVGLAGQAPSATAADENICGKWVRGAILDKYRSMGGVNAKLGCPTTDELDLPNGRGKRSVFQGGSIYWSQGTGAHPVWGEIGRKWGDLGWERGKLGMPLTDELTNPDGYGKRQQYQGGTIYWSSNSGAHPVWGAIGSLWARYGYERGMFGYPRTDERTGYDGVVSQTFTGGESLKWHPPGTDCDANACVSYEQVCNDRYFHDVQVFHGNETQIYVWPTNVGEQATPSDEPEFWDRLFRCVPFPNGLNETQKESLYKQFACHVRWNQRGQFAGPDWALEANRPNIGWERFDEWTEVVPQVGGHGCNWKA